MNHSKQLKLTSMKKKQIKVKSCKARWKSLEAKGYNGRDARGRVRTKKTNVNIEELAKSVIIPPDTDTETPYGIPIDARLAINLISDFHSLISEAILKRFIDGKEIEFDFSNKRGQDAVRKSMNDLVDMLKRSCAITVDKNVLLKTLSQPGCEGLRFYLCKKHTDTNFLSLVTVGVDSEGKDHLYTYESTNEKRIEKIASQVQTLSLVSEYGHPPGSSFQGNQPLKEVYDDQPYVLLNYALDITEVKRKKLIELAGKKKKK